MTDYYDQALKTPAYREARARKADLIADVCGDRLIHARRVFDLGSGSGLVRARLEERRGAPVYGIEIEKLTIVDRRRTIVGDLTRVPLKDDSIDFGIANHVYEHVSDLDRFFAEMARVLAPGGCIYLTAGSRCALIEPHYRIPTLSWWPKAISARVVRWSGRGDGYEGIDFKTHRQIVRSASCADLVLVDITAHVVEEYAHRYHSRVGRALARITGRLPANTLETALRWLSPQWFFLVRRKGDA